MTSDRASDPQPPAISKEIAALLDKIRQLAKQEIPEDIFQENVLKALQSSVKEQAQDYKAVKETLERCIGVMDKWIEILQGMLEEVEVLETNRAKRERFGPGWWQHRQAALRAAFAEDTQKGLEEWLQTFTEALLAWELDLCQRLAQEDFPFPATFADSLVLFQEGVRSIRNEDYPQALEMLEYLAGEKPLLPGGFRLDKHSRALLLVFAGRVYFYNMLLDDRTLEYIQQASRLAPDDGRPDAALGEYHLVQDEDDQALQSFQLAIEKSPDLPDGYLGLAFYFEAQELWEDAQDWYGRAAEKVRVERDPLIALRRLRLSVNGNAYLSLASGIRTENPERALRAVDRALELEILNDEDYPERPAYQLRGEILEELGHSQEAAQDFLEVGMHYHWSQKYQLAVDFFARANRLDPELLPVYWYWTDALQVLSNLNEPPYVDEKHVQESLGVWEEGIQRQLPDEDHSWAYLARAFISEQQARLLAGDEQDKSWFLWWEAAAYVERAILLREDDGFHWAYLSRFYNLLRINSNGLHAADRAVALNPEELSILDEQAIILANIGRPKAALKVVAEALKAEANTWRQAMKAYAFMGLERYKDALELLVKAVEESPMDIWYRELKAICHSALDEIDEAVAEYSWVLDRQEEPGYGDNPLTYAWAYYYLGLFEDASRFDQAMAILKGLLEDPILAGYARRCLGLCYLAKGELDEKLLDESLGKGIRQADNVRDLDELLNLDLQLLKKHTSPKLELEKVVSGFERLIQERRKRVKKLVAPQREFAAILDLVDQRGETGDWPWVGVKAGLARLAGESQDWEEAARIYAELLEVDDFFPEAHLGLTRAITELQIEGEDLMRAGKPKRALARFSLAFELASSNGDDIQMAGLHACLGYAHFGLRNSSRARQEFRIALDLYTSIYEDGWSLGESVRYMIRDTSQYWALQDEWSSLEEILDAKMKPRMSEARSALSHYLSSTYQLEADTTESQYWPLTVPISVEIGVGLIPEDTSEGWPLLETYIPEMRENLQNEMGVQVPGVRIHGNEGDIPPNSHIILLSEIPRAMGTVEIGHVYCPASKQKLMDLGIAESELLEAAHPRTGEAGYWLPEKYQDLLSQHAIIVWEDPLIFMVHHLVAVLRPELAEFLGVQETNNLLNTWAEEEDLRELIEACVPNPELRIRFCRVLRALLQEQVPLTRPRDILEAVQSSRLEDDPSQAVRAVRCRLKDLLPGNRREDKRVEVPLELETSIQAWLWHEEGKRFLAALPQDIQGWLEDISKLVDSASQDVALVVANAALRPALRRLVELELPSVMVLSQEELLDEPR